MLHDSRAVVRERWDTVRGRRVRSLEAGFDRAGGPVVVLVPGLGAPRYLEDTLARCAAWAHAFLLDVPGFGHVGANACEPALSAVAETVAAWLSEVPGPSVLLAGHSTGAQAALHATLARPDRVHRLVLLGPTFPPELRRFRGLGAAFVRNALHEPPGLVGALGPDYLRAGPEALARFVRSAQHDEPEKLIKSVECPVFFGRGRHDAFAPRSWMDRLAASANHGGSWTVEGAHTFPYHRGVLTAHLLARAGS
ncbi:alpha/beta fold hydrolase [Amycolatopsis regifaucium]|uniref:AB hydrolase-1 domain-containing protein n=1 Tax=Amycolatopsis regifaucium TaxID=546365 RepID=A0A154MHZ7_9PSEU|nr:alpha/beta hydrolase [Amycolatopsis regifaucium]KZB83750.1 hypothetical protein AVL48_34695 [Amycolatopsis regifaucium]OKA06810.1 hypothetical protein ATP06_0219935 [Amycolatopsis regifaucium]